MHTVTSNAASDSGQHATQSVLGRKVLCRLSSMSVLHLNIVLCGNQDILCCCNATGHLMLHR